MMFLFALVFVTQIAFASGSFLTFGLGDGGDSLSAATGRQNYRAQAGSGLFLTMGKMLTVSKSIPHWFEFQIGFGYLFHSDSREKGNSVSWVRIPLEAIYFYKNTTENFRLGWGSTYHINNSINGRGSNSSATTNVENAWGFVLTAEKLWLTEKKETISVGIRHTQINYRLTAFDKVINANSLGLTFTGFLF